MTTRLVDAAPKDPIDPALRPKNLDEYVGQERIKANLKVYIRAAIQRGEADEGLVDLGLAVAELGQGQHEGVVVFGFGRGLGLSGGCGGGGAELDGDLAPKLQHEALRRLFAHTRRGGQGAGVFCVDGRGEALQA